MALPLFRTQALIAPQQPRLPAAPVEYSQRYGDDLTNILRLYFNQLQNFNQLFTTSTGGALLQFPSGSFQDNTTQLGSTTYSAPVTFTQVDYSNNVILSDSTATFTGSRSGTTLTASAVTGTIYVGSHILGTGWETSTFTASIAANVMTVTAVASGTIAVGDYLVDGTLVPAGARIAAFIGGSGGTGTYLINIPDGTKLTAPSDSFKAYGIYVTNQLTGTTGGAGTYSTSTSGTIASASISTRATSRMTALVSGTYNFQWSGQFQNTDNAAWDVNVWLRINGVDVTGSNGKVTMQARKSAGVYAKSINGWNYVVNLTANDYVELVFLPESTQVSLVNYPAVAGPPAVPATASVIATMVFVSALFPTT